MVNGVGILKKKEIEYLNSDNGLQPGLPFSVFQDIDSNFWISGYGGISKYDGSKLFNFNSNNGIVDTDIICSCLDSKNNKWFGTRNGRILMYDGKRFNYISFGNYSIQSRITSIIESKNGIMLFSTDGAGLVISNKGNYTVITEKDGLPSNNIYSLLDEKGIIWIGTENGICRFNLKKFLAQINQDGDIISCFKNYSYADGFYGVNCSKASFKDKENNLWFGTKDRVTILHPEGDPFDSIPPNPQLLELELFGEKIEWQKLFSESENKIKLSNSIEISSLYFDSLSKYFSIPINLSLPYYANNIGFKFVGITTKYPQKVKYKFKMEGLDKFWSKPSSENVVTYNNLSPGEYSFKLVAMNSDGNWSKEFKYCFIISPPWWQTWWFRALVVLMIVVAIWSYIKWRERSLKIRQKELEETVVERTTEIVRKNHLIEEKQREIIDSINYAKRIQYTLLAHEDFLKENIPNHFVYFNPKDIVSGDYYWASKRGNKFYLAVCDSTGHGVPGAFMSLLNIGFLTEAINEKGIVKPNEIFDFVRQRLIDNISKEGQKDGFDGILICIETEGNNTSITYTAANNAPILISNGEMKDLECDRMPVGKGERTDKFQLFTIDYKHGDTLYLYTDGYADQFGGPRGKKFMYKKLNQYLQEISILKLDQQKEKLNVEFEVWRGDLEQVDDVCVIGLKL